MAIDFLICCLLLLSLAINLLALGAFWVTPGLRTTANRFVINLVIVNIIGCIALAPTLLINTTNLTIKQFYSKSNNNETNSLVNNINNSIEYVVDNNIKRITSAWPRGVTINSTMATVATHVECNGTQCSEVVIDNDDDQIVIDGVWATAQSRMGERYWSVDLAAALGALSVLLVVGDTWCAVTDPLRYHSRISGLKAWVLIGITWFLGIFFGVLSALRDHAFVSNDELTNNDRFMALLPNDLYNMIYSCLYFIVIILLPFGFVCGMYWRIFSEARENGLRMRQNGSSPLLQSAFNLTRDHHHGSAAMIARRMSERDVLKPLLTPVHRPSTQTTTSETKDSDQQDQQESQSDAVPVKPDRNQNILLTLSTASDELRRNHSARQLYLLGSSQDLNNPDFSIGPIRQVQSTPNLQRSHSASNIGGLTASCNYHHQSGNGLQLPSAHIPPKALSYMTSIRHRLSNASSLFKYREESRAARISILVVIMFLVSYLPYGLLVLLQGRATGSLFVNSKQVAIVMVLLAHFSSPFIFAYRNKRVRRGVRRLFRLESKNGERHIYKIGTKASINVRRSTSKASTYSVSSCKYLTPHIVTNGTFLMEIEKCHYLKKSATTPNKDNRNLLHPPIDPNQFCSPKQQFNSPEHNKTNAKVIKSLLVQDRRSILKRVCDSSRKLGCATNSCTTSDNEQTDV